MRTLLLIFLIFPFTKVLPLETYNQPYALAASAFILMLKPNLIFRMKAIDAGMLIYFAILGVLLVLFALPSGIETRDLQLLLIYVSPLIIVPAALDAMRQNPHRARKILSAGIAIWLAVGLLQTAIDPGLLNFLVSNSSEVGANIADSGRGVLSLAPESTHHGFQMVVLAASLLLLQGSVILAGLALAAAVLVAKSSSAVLALAVGVFVWVVLRPWRWPLLVALYAARTIAEPVATLVFDEGSRIGRLMTIASNLDFEVLFADYSVNARLYGLYAPISETIANGLVPLGIRHADWIMMRDAILSQNPQIIALSNAGPASGLGIVFVQAGIFSIPVLAYFFWRICMSHASTWRGIVPVGAFFVFSGQLYLSTPTFSLLLAAAIFSATRDYRQSSSSKHGPVPANRQNLRPGTAIPNE